MTRSRSGSRTTTSPRLDRAGQPPVGDPPPETEPAESDLNLAVATRSWLAAVCGAFALPRYWLAQARQLDGMIWYLP